MHAGEDSLLSLEESYIGFKGGHLGTLTVETVPLVPICGGKSQSPARPWSRETPFLGTERMQSDPLHLSSGVGPQAAVQRGFRRCSLGILTLFSVGWGLELGLQLFQESHRGLLQ